MKKLADISAFEALQNQSSSAVSELAVFNMDAEEILDYIVRGNYHHSTGDGIAAAAMKYVQELMDEMPDEDSVYEFWSRAETTERELKKLIEEEYPELADAMWTEGDNGEDEEPDEESYAAYGGVDGICESFTMLATEFAEDLIRRRKNKRRL